MSREVICQIRAICELASSPSSSLTLDDRGAIEGAFVESLRLLRAARGIGQLAKWTSYSPDPRNGTVYTQKVTLPEGPDGTGPLATFFHVMHESASGDSYGTIETFVTREAADAAALQEAIRRNAIYEPPSLSSAGSTNSDKGGVQ
jgi:hypothetical protein